MMTMRFLIIYLWFICNTSGVLGAQDISFFRNYEQSTRPSDLEKTRQEIDAQYAEDAGESYIFSVAAEADTFLTFYTNFDIDAKGEYKPWLVLKRLPAGSTQIWTLSPDKLGPLDFISFYDISESGITVLDGIPLLWLI